LAITGVWRSARLITSCTSPESAGEPLALAADRYRLSAMGTGNARLIADAVTAALGLPDPRRSGR
jgi:hypothetical protein